MLRRHQHDRLRPRSGAPNEVEPGLCHRQGISVGHGLARGTTAAGWFYYCWGPGKPGPATNGRTTRRRRRRRKRKRQQRGLIPHERTRRADLPPAAESPTVRARGPRQRGPATLPLVRGGAPARPKAARGAADVRQPAVRRGADRGGHRGEPAPAPALLRRHGPGRLLQRVAGQGAQERRRAVRRAAGRGRGRQAQPQPAPLEEGVGRGVGRRPARGAGLCCLRALCSVAGVSSLIMKNYLPTCPSLTK